jgi:hypothetical protein
MYRQVKFVHPSVSMRLKLCKIPAELSTPVLTPRTPLRDCRARESDPKKFRLVRKRADGQGLAQGGTLRVGGGGALGYSTVREQYQWKDALLGLYRSFVTPFKLVGKSLAQDDALGGGGGDDYGTVKEQHLWHGALLGIDHLKHHSIWLAVSNIALKQMGSNSSRVMQGVTALFRNSVGALL